MKIKSKKKLLSPLEKALRDFTYQCNRVKGDFNFHKIRTFLDFRVTLGYSKANTERQFPKEQLEKEISFQELKELLLQEETKLRERFKEVKLEEEAIEPEFFPNVLEEYFRSKIHYTPPSRQIPITIHFNDKTFYNPKFPDQKATLISRQTIFAEEVLRKILLENKHGLLLRGQVGHGKTYVIASVIKNLIEKKFFEGKSLSPWPILYVTKVSIVEQTRRVLFKQFGLTEDDVSITNIEQLRAAFGELMVRQELIHFRGQPTMKWKFRKNVHPILVILDECQTVKNEGSQQSEILQAFNEIKDIYGIDTYLIMLSATPFTRVSEAKVFAVATRALFSFGAASNVPIANDNWSIFAKQISAPSEPYDYCEAAMERMMDYLKDYIVQMRGIRSKHKAINGVQLISFRTLEEREQYDNALNEYYEEKARAESNESMSASQARFCILTAFLKFRQKAEWLKAEYLAQAMYESVEHNGKAALCALNFKATICRIVSILVNDYNVSRDKISLIWGGYSPKSKSKKQKLKEQIKNNPDLIEKLEEEGIDIEDILGIDLDEKPAVPETEYESSLRLGIPPKYERQKDVDKFQSGESLYCLFTFKAGCFGLSLHHEFEHTRSRELYAATTYSAIEMVQGLGRAPRLTSLSDTLQVVVFYRGTIEESVAARVSQKLKVLRKVVGSRESWESIIVGEKYCRRVKADKIALPIPSATDDEEENNGTDLYYDDNEDEEQEVKVEIIER